MTIAYLGNFNNKNSDKTEEHIKKALEDLGHQVTVFPEDKLWAVSDINKHDIFLFHKGGISTELMVKVLNEVIAKKVFWYFDKVYLGERENYLESILPYVDYGFITDGTWVRRHKYNNLHLLRQGIGKPQKGKYKEKYKCDVAFVGSIYGDREELVMGLQSYYGDKFKIFTGVFNDDLADLCATAKVIVAPPTPSTNFYWSSRLYQIIGNNGFIVHPELYEMKDEGWIEGKHYAGYKRIREMIPTIDHFLKNEKEREKIRDEGFKLVQNFTYKERVKQLYEKIKN